MKRSRLRQRRLMVMRTNAKGRTELTGAGTEVALFLLFASAFHQADAINRLEGAKQDESFVPCCRINAEHVGEPVHAVVEINVGGAGRVLGGEFPRRWPVKEMAGLIAMFVIGLRLDDDAGGLSVNQFAADQLTSADQGVSFEEGTVDHGRKGT